MSARQPKGFPAIPGGGTSSDSLLKGTHAGPAAIEVRYFLAGIGAVTVSIAWQTSRAGWVQGQAEGMESTVASIGRVLHGYGRRPPKTVLRSCHEGRRQRLGQTGRQSDAECARSTASFQRAEEEGHGRTLGDAMLSDAASFT